MRLPLTKKLIFCGVTLALLLSAAELAAYLLGRHADLDIRYRENEEFCRLGRVPTFVRRGSQMVRRPLLGRMLRRERFAASRAPGSIRFFCFGGSSTHGYTLTNGVEQHVSQHFPKLLGDHLRRTHPRREVEAINLGAPGMVSSQVLLLARQMVRWSPDFVVFYMGHNEANPISQQLAREAPRPLGMIRQRWHTYGWLLNLTELAAGRLGLFELQPAELEVSRTQGRFKHNLLQAIALFQRAGVKVYVCTIVGRAQLRPRTAQSPEQTTNTLIRQAARESGAVLVELEALFRRELRADRAQPMDRLLSDNVHPTRLGYRLIAAEISRVVSAQFKGGS